VFKSLNKTLRIQIVTNITEKAVQNDIIAHLVSTEYPNKGTI